MELITVALASLGVIQALFLSVYLLRVKQGNPVANTLLALSLLGLSVRIGKSVFNHFIMIEPWQRNLGLAGILLAGPSLWLYGRALADRSFQFSRTDVMHYLPAILFVVCSAWIPNNFTLAAYISYLLVMSHWAGYIIASEYQRRVLSNAGSIDLARWYRYLLLGSACLWVYYLGVFVRVIPFYIGGAIVYSILIYAFTYLLLQRHRFVLEKYRGSGATREQNQQIIQQLKQLFADEQSFLDPRLTLAKVADKLAVPARRLSQAVNELERCNFSEFVNRHRIAQAQQLLSDSTNTLKLSVMAVECGFSNVTNFNLAFKAQTGKTPSAFRQEATDID